MSPTFQKVFVVLVIVLILAVDCDAKRRYSKKIPSSRTMRQRKSQVAKEFELRETNPPNFLRLVIMRLVYGIAAQMNLEDRVADWFNGAFAPPNADYDDYGLSGGFDDFGAGDLF